MAKRHAGAETAGPSQRQLRVAEEVRHALSAVFARADFRDPELAGLHVTVTEVRASPDLKHMTAFVSGLGGGTPVTITSVELCLYGADLLNDPSLRQGLVNLWSAEVAATLADICEPKQPASSRTPSRASA